MNVLDLAGSVCTSQPVLAMASSCVTSTPVYRKDLGPEDLHQYQTVASDHQVSHAKSMLWLGMGLGKTVSTLTTIARMMDELRVYGTLVVGPLRVCQTVWKQEAAKWSHTQHLRVELVLGSASERAGAMGRRADVYIINYENIPWLVTFLMHHYLERGRQLPFNFAVFDEITKLKNSSAVRHKRLREILPYIPYRTGLTGTPASNGYKDLFGQYLALDDGERLGTKVTVFRENLAAQQVTYAGGMDMSQAKAIEGKENRQVYPLIHRSIADITIEMASRDYLDMPDVVYNDLWITLPLEARKKYDQLETEMFMEMDSGAQIEVFSAGAKTGKCLQAANGAVYLNPGDPDWEALHDAKLDALEDVVEEASGAPVLVLYAFKHDRDRILKKYPEAEEFKSGMSVKKVQDLVSRWNAGSVSMLLGHPASMGHGLNLAQGGHIAVWFGLNWSLELYEQANARLDRQGQTQTVLIHRILAKGTMDEAVRMALDSKASTQQDLKKAISDYRLIFGK